MGEEERHKLSSEAAATPFQALVLCTESGGTEAVDRWKADCAPRSIRMVQMLAQGGECRRFTAHYISGREDGRGGEWQCQ